MPERRLNFYYYFCENSRREALVYQPVPAEEIPMFHYGAIVSLDGAFGTALSECLDLLIHILSDAEKDGHYIFTEALLEKYFSDIEGDLLRSFVLQCLMDTPSFPDLGILMPTKIKNYETFLSQCAESKLDCTLTHYEEFSAHEMDTIRGGDTIVIELGDVLRGHQIRMSEIGKIASNFPNSEELETALTISLAWALSYKRPTAQAIIDTVCTAVGDTSAKITYRIYKLNLLTDLFSATLQEMFRHRKIIKRCECCKRFMIPSKRADEKYCDIERAEYNSRTCKNQIRYLKKQIRDAKLGECWKMHNSIKQMIHRKYGGYSEEYRNFMDGSIARREQVRNGTLDEHEYEAWLNGLYKKKKAQSHTV